MKIKFHVLSKVSGNKVEHKETKHKSSSVKKQNRQTLSKTHQGKKRKKS